MKTIFFGSFAGLALLFSSCDEKKAEVQHPVFSTGMNFGPYGGDDSKASTTVKVKHFDQQLHWIVKISPTEGNEKDFPKIAALFTEKKPSDYSVHFYANQTTVELEDGDGFKLTKFVIIDYFETPATHETTSSGETCSLEFSGSIKLDGDLAERIRDCSLTTKYTPALRDALSGNK